MSRAREQGQVPCLLLRGLEWASEHTGHHRMLFCNSSSRGILCSHLVFLSNHTHTHAHIKLKINVLKTKNAISKRRKLNDLYELCESRI